MTVHLEIPTIRYIGNGVTTDYTFDWSFAALDEIYVQLDGTLLVEGILYELEDVDLANGGTIRFNVAPDDGAEIVIYRRTPITQEVDYVDFQAFPADTHEFQMDKDTRILQEMIFGGIAIGGRVDLTAVQYPTYVEIENTSGTNAILLPWTLDGNKAGVFYGELVPDGDVGPSAGEATTKGDGYIWWFEGEAPLVGGDPNIVMSTAQIDVVTTQADPTVAVAELRYDANTGEVKYGYETAFTDEAGITVPPTGLLEYWIKFEVLTGTALERLNSPVDTWIDAYDVIGEAAEYNGWYVQDPGSSQAVTARFTIAPDDGGGSPDTGQAISRYVTLTAEQT